ncbi:MAG TPA: nitroreductase family protein [Thermodesulfobacteriota bacterium]|nr:nitroreductase family protein [Thermodesulfobacteriota bacterium]
MELHEIIEKRRTIRVFKKKATEEQLKKIILAGTRAPSARNTQPWEFIIIDDQKLIDQIAERKYQLSLTVPPGAGEGPDQVKERAVGQKKSFENASAVAVCHQKGTASSAWLCIENMSLVAAAEGLGSGIVVFWGEQEKEVKKILGLPEDYELAAVLKIGQPGEKPSPPPKRPDFSWLHRNKF